MKDTLGIDDIREFIRKLLEEMDFHFEDYFDSRDFSELYDNKITFNQVSIDAVLLGSKEYYLEVLKPEKKEEFKEKVGYINIQINKFIHDYANDASKVPIYEKSDFLRFRHVPDDFGIEYILFERNKERENREKREREAKMIDEKYTPSATAGDYSPSCPWNAPGMCMSDFI